MTEGKAVDGEKGEGRMRRRESVGWGEGRVVDKKKGELQGWGENRAAGGGVQRALLPVQPRPGLKAPLGRHCLHTLICHNSTQHRLTHS